VERGWLIDHQNRNRHLVQHLDGYAAKYDASNPVTRIGAHDQHVRADFSHALQDELASGMRGAVHGDASRADAMPIQIHFQAVGQCQSKLA
jgi:hypothetical protein